MNIRFPFMSDSKQPIFPDAHTHRYTGQPNSVYCLTPGSEPMHGFFSTGYHPWYDFPFSNEHDFNASLAALLHQPGFVAVGECGLDYARSLYGRSQQNEIFKMHLRFSEANKMPVIIHCLRAYHDLWPLIRNFRIPLLLHAFLPTADNIRQVTSLTQVYVSFGKRESLRPGFAEALKSLPYERILPESDDEIGGTAAICTLMADILGMQTSQFLKLMEKNFRRFYLGE